MKTTLKILLVAAALIASASKLSAQPSDPFTVSAAAHTASTATIDFSYPVPSPNSVTITVGDSIRFNGSGPSSEHPLQQVTGATSDTPTSGGFASSSKPYTVTFDAAGTYYYRCTAHGVAAQNGTMRGRIIVQSAGSSTPTPTATPTATPQPGCDAAPSASKQNSPANGAKISRTTPTLSWSATTCASSYKVAVCKDKKGGSVVDQKTTTRTSYRTKQLSKKHTYFWTVKACNTFGCSAASLSHFAVK